jgi:pimeloyl-ACP methyl ester carboxylesterase
VVIPSLPGYGFSDRPTERGMTRARVAGLWGRLMTEVLGHERFAAHGGDVGGDVTQLLALDRPDSLVGIHLTGVPYSNLAAFAGDASDLSAAERDYVERGRRWVQEEGAYAAIQSTKPQTLAYGLNDSPAGLAAWIVEKFRAWSDCGGDVESRFARDQLLTNLTIYWATATINASTRVYYEERQAPPSSARVPVPAGFAVFANEFVPEGTPPRELAERTFDVRRWSEQPRGGHFAALEEPAALAEEIRAFFRPLRG